MNTIAAAEFLERAMDPGFGPALIDVRSEGEFAEGALPGFANFPILRNEERHQVGLAYKNSGQAEAVRLGNELVAPTRAERVSQWARAIDVSGARRGFVACWRGGLRSKIATEWIHSEGRAVARIEGGYKALRHELIAPFVDPGTGFGGLRVISGNTGSGKTRIFRALAAQGVPWVDLEGHAQHRGSSFGRRLGDPVPKQASFENLVGWDLYRLRVRGVSEFWVEDESRCVGAVNIPASMKEAMGKAPVALLEVPMQRRVANILDEYVTEPLRLGISLAALKDELVRCTVALTRRLGGGLTAEIVADIRAADTDERHGVWIEKLLLHYYDKAYEHAFQRQQRPILFRGDEIACRQWILDRSG